MEMFQILVRPFENEAGVEFGGWWVVTRMRHTCWNGHVHRFLRLNLA